MKWIYLLIIILFNIAVSANVLITFAGDLNASVIPTNNKDISKIFRSVSSTLLNDDFTIANLECPISKRGIAAEDKQFTFRANPITAKTLHENGIDAVTIANNHALDFGTDAFIDTLKILQSATIKFAGGGINILKIPQPTLKIKDTSIKLIATSRVLPNVNWTATNKRPGLSSVYNPETIIADIKKADKNDDNIIAIYIHWGKEKEIIANKIQRKLAYQLIDAGADVIIGTHPHVLQGFEWYKGKLIIYSLGNFIFSCSSRNTMLLQLTANKNKIIQYKVIPVKLADKTPVIIKKEKEKQKIYKLLTDISFNAVITDEGKIIMKNHSK